MSPDSSGRTAGASDSHFSFCASLPACILFESPFKSSRRLSRYPAMRSSFLVIALLMSGVLLVTADAVSASRQLEATTRGAEKLVGVAHKEVARGSLPVARASLPVLDRQEERIFLESLLFSSRFIASLLLINVDLRNLYFKHPNPHEDEDLLDILRKMTMNVNYIGRRGSVTPLYHEMAARRFDVRQVEVPEELLSSEGCVYFVLRSRLRSIQPSAYNSVVDALRKYLSELEVAILLSRAKEMHESGAVVENEQFEAWRVGKITPEAVRSAFVNQRPLMPESSAFRKPTPFRVDDGRFLRKILRDYETYCRNPDAFAKNKYQ